MIELPIFALHAAVLPGGVLPLRVFEPRYLDMITRCLREESRFGVCMIREGNDTGLPAEIFETGVTVKIVDWERLRNGLLGVTVEGERKFEIRSSRVEKDQLRVAEAELLDPEPEAPLPDLYRPLAELLGKVLAKLPSPYDRLEFRMDDAGWVGARLTEILPLKMSVKQRLLEFNEPKVRLEHIRLALQEKNFV